MVVSFTHTDACGPPVLPGAGNPTLPGDARAASTRVATVWRRPAAPLPGVVPLPRGRGSRAGDLRPRCSPLCDVALPVYRRYRWRPRGDGRLHARPLSLVPQIGLPPDSVPGYVATMWLG